MGKQTQRNHVGRTAGNVLEEGMKSRITRSGHEVIKRSVNVSFWFSYSSFYKILLLMFVSQVIMGCYYIVSWMFQEGLFCCPLVHL